MAIQGYMESTLGSSEIYHETGGDNTTKKAIAMIRSAKRLEVEDIEAAYTAVRQITDSLTRAAMRAYDEGRIVLLYNSNTKESINQSLPFITFLSKSTNTYVTYLFMDRYITITRDGAMNLKSSDLRDLLTGALIGNALKLNYNGLVTNQYLEKTLMSIYTKFITRILNREFSMAADKVLFDTIQYWINRFFLTRVFGSKESQESIERLSASHFRFVDELKYDEIRKIYDDVDPLKFSELLDLMKNQFIRMKTLNIGVFLSDWINYYYTPALLAVDNVEYLIFMILTMLYGNNAIISIAASDVVKETKNIKSFRGELLKIVQ